jgi:hypothetical protein
MNFARLPNQCSLGASFTYSAGSGTFASQYLVPASGQDGGETKQSREAAETKIFTSETARVREAVQIQ